MELIPMRTMGSRKHTMHLKLFLDRFPILIDTGETFSDEARQKALEIYRAMGNRSGAFILSLTPDLAGPGENMLSLYQMAAAYLTRYCLRHGTVDGARMAHIVFSFLDFIGPRGSEEWTLDHLDNYRTERLRVVSLARAEEEVGCLLDFATFCGIAGL